MHINLLILSCLFIEIQTLCNLVSFEHSNVNAVLTSAVVPVDRLLHSLSETLLYATAIII